MTAQQKAHAEESGCPAAPPPTGARSAHAREPGLGAEGPGVATRAHPARPETGAGRRGAAAGPEGCGSDLPLQRRIATNHRTPKRPTVSTIEGRPRSADASCPVASWARGSGVTLNVRVPETSSNRPEKGEGRFRGPPALRRRTEVGGGSKRGQERPSWVVGRSRQGRGQGCAPWAVLEGPQRLPSLVTPRGPAQGGGLSPTQAVSGCQRLDPEGALNCG